MPDANGRLVICLKTIGDRFYVFGTTAFLLVLLALQGWQALVIWAILIPVQVIRARREEGVLREAFGAEYEASRRSTWF